MLRALNTLFLHPVKINDSSSTGSAMLVFMSDIKGYIRQYNCTYCKTVSFYFAIYKVQLPDISVAIFKIIFKTSIAELGVDESSLL